jgi:hypothetical protein
MSKIHFKYLKQKKDFLSIKKSFKKIKSTCNIFTFFQFLLKNMR